MSRMDNIMDCFSGAEYFTKIDLKSGYHHIIIKEGNKSKIAFKKKYNLYEWSIFLLVCLMHQILS